MGRSPGHRQDSGPASRLLQFLGLWTLQTASIWGGGRSRARVNYRFSQDELSVLELVRPKGEQRVVECQMDRHR